MSRQLSIPPIGRRQGLLRAPAISAVAVLTLALSGCGEPDDDDGDGGGTGYLAQQRTEAAAAGTEPAQRADEGRDPGDALVDLCHGHTPARA